jgi:CubicO group peptidase (beta-lactamase class C family)
VRRYKSRRKDYASGCFSRRRNASNFIVAAPLSVANKRSEIMRNKRNENCAAPSRAQFLELESSNIEKQMEKLKTDLDRHLAKRIVFSILFLLIFTCSVWAQSDKVDGYIKSEMQRQKIPGLALAVVRNGTAIKAQGYGFANLELKVPATADTVFYSGSIAKSFTATAVMMLVEEGKISLDDKIGKYLNNTPESWKDITIRQMLNHTAGFKFDNYELNLRLDYTDEEILKSDAALPLNFSPGTKWQYSNIGYVLLGFVIEKVTGKFYGDFLKERIFAPLGMNSTGIISVDGLIPNRAAGYRLVKGEVKNQEYASPTFCRTADGSMYFSVLDLIKWDAALYSEKLLRKTSLDAMWMPTRFGDKTALYGFAWALDEIRGRRIVKHGGLWLGFTTQISRFVDNKLTVIVLVNQAAVNCETIANHVAGLYDSELQPIERKAVRVDPKILLSYTGRYETVYGSTINIEIEGGKLVLLETGFPKVELLPESETRFFSKEEQDIYTDFFREPNGQVTHMILHSGVDWEAKRVK